MKKLILIISSLSVSAVLAIADIPGDTVWYEQIQTREAQLEPIIKGLRSDDLALKIASLRTALPLVAESLPVSIKLVDALPASGRDDLYKNQYVTISETLARIQGAGLPEPADRHGLVHTINQFTEWLIMARYTEAINEDQYQEYAQPLINVTAAFLQERFSADLTAALEEDSDEKI